jgi:hypothetical protein
VSRNPYFPLVLQAFGNSVWTVFLALVTTSSEAPVSWSPHSSFGFASIWALRMGGVSWRCPQQFLRRPCLGIHTFLWFCKHWPQTFMRRQCLGIHTFLFGFANIWALRMGGVLWRQCLGIHTFLLVLEAFWALRMGGVLGIGHNKLCGASVS